MLGMTFHTNEETNKYQLFISDNKYLVHVPCIIFVDCKIKVDESTDK